MTYTLACDAGAYAVTGQAARRGATAFCSIASTAIWFPVAPGVTSLPAAPTEVVNPSPVAANQATVPPDWDDDAPDLCYLFQDILPVGQPPLFPTEQTVTYVHLPFLETVETVGITKARLVVGEFPYALTLPGEAVTLRTRARLSTIDAILTGDAGSLAITGQDAALRQGWAIVAGTGALAITGQDAGLGPVSAFDAGAYVLTGQDAALRQGWAMTADAGAFELIGEDAGFAPALPTYELVADAGALVITGQDAGPIVMPADAGALTISGQDATLQTASATDPLFADVRILAHMDGTGTSYTDSSSFANTITAYGSATQSTSQKKYGTAATDFPDGLGVVYMDNTATALGTGNWSLELWARLTTSSGVGRSLITWRINTNSYAYLGIDATNGELTWSGFLTLSGATMSLNTWHYILVVNENDEITIWLDDTQLDAIGSYGPETIDGSSNYNGGVYIGNEDRTSGFSADYGFIGQIDELRITKAVRTGGTVPTAPFPNS